MKIALPVSSSNYGDKKSSNALLPLIPEKIKVRSKEDLVTLELRSIPADPDSIKVKFSMGIIEGGEPPRQLLNWLRNVVRVFTGLNIGDDGLAQIQLMPQLARGRAYSLWESNLGNQCIQEIKRQLSKNSTDLGTARRKRDEKRNALAVATNARRALAPLDPGIAAADAAVTAAQLEYDAAVAAYNVLTPIVANLTTDRDNQDWQKDQYKTPQAVMDAIHHTLKNLMPTKILQRTKRYLRREARKPVDMKVRECYLRILHINEQELTKLPPKFDDTQQLAGDEITEILLFGTPKSWQKEMDRQGFDPIEHDPAEVVDFMERIENAEEHDNDPKTKTVNNNNKKDTKKGSNNNNNKNDGSKEFYCEVHGKNPNHNTSNCNQIKRLKAEAAGNKKKSFSGKSKNKTWTRKAQEETEKSKKDLATFIKKAVDAKVRQELKSLDRKRKSDSDDESLDNFMADAELKDFDYSGLEKLSLDDIKVPKKGDTKVTFAKKVTTSSASQDEEDGLNDDLGSVLSDKDDISV